MAPAQSKQPSNARAYALCRLLHPTSPCRFTTGEYHDSSLFLDFFLYLRGGVFLEIGAQDGLSEGSVSRFFEESLGWNGVLIEPNHN
eukprot:4976170-Prymnesium_polylepis.1